MKSPWKILAKLVPRRQPKTTEESSGEPAIDTDQVGIGQQQQLGPPPSWTAALPETAPVERPPLEHEAYAISDLAEHNIDQVLSTPADSALRTRTHHRTRQPRSGAAVSQPEGKTSKRSSSDRGGERAEHARVGREDRVVPNSATQSRADPTQTPPPSDFGKQVAELDEEIKQLRIQLAQKLQLQNIQLKKMLDRFDLT